MRIVIDYRPGNEGGWVQIQREANDRKIYRESTFWCHVRRAFNNLGFDAIYKRMAADKHMVDQHEFYVRDRKFTFCVRDPEYYREMAYTDYNQTGCKKLRLHVWEPKQIGVRLAAVQ